MRFEEKTRLKRDDFTGSCQRIKVELSKMKPLPIAARSRSFK